MKRILTAALGLVLCGTFSSPAAEPENGGLDIVQVRPNFYMIAGAGGNIALQAVARAPADGHTLLLLASPHAVNVSLYPSNPVSLTKDIIPVASLNHDTFALLVNPSMPVNTVELVA